MKKAVEETTLASARAADFLATEIGVPQSEALPYVNQFAVLSEIFRNIPTPNAQQLLAIKSWFWTTTLSGYFGGWNGGQMAADAKSVRAFAAGNVSAIAVPAALPTDRVWKIKAFRSNSAVSKMLGIMLGHGGPVDIVNGQKIDPGKSLAWSNDKEYHHFFPKAFVERASLGNPNLVANIILLTSASNIYIRDTAPSKYLGDLIHEHGRQEIVSRLAAALVPESALDRALVDDYDGFLDARSAHLHSIAGALMGSRQSITSETIEVVDEDDVDSDSED